MDNIVGLGAAGCNIAKLFEKYSQYKVYKIDTHLDEENCFCLEEKDSPESYEKTCPDLESFFSKIQGDTLFIVGGGGNVSGASLRILQKLYKKSNIHLLYIIPNLKDLSRTSYLQNKLTYNVFQEYARSGIFKKIILLSNDCIENIVGDVPILSRNLKINEFIVNIIHSINVFSNTEAVIDNSENPKDSARICTLGIYKLFEQENHLYELQWISDKRYYFAINEKTLSSDGSVLRKIREHLSSQEQNCSYTIHSTNYPSYCFLIAYTSLIQPLDKEKTV